MASLLPIRAPINPSAIDTRQPPRVEPASARAFGDWNMCARSLSDADDVLLDALEQRRAFSPDRLDGRGALRLLKAVRDIQGRAGFG